MLANKMPLAIYLEIPFSNLTYILPIFLTISMSGLRTNEINFHESPETKHQTARVEHNSQATNGIIHIFFVPSSFLI